jgi:hypothetical protein
MTTAVPATHAGRSIPRFASPPVRQRRHADSRVKRSGEIGCRSAAATIERGQDLTGRLLHAATATGGSTASRVKQR